MKAFMLALILAAVMSTTAVNIVAAHDGHITASAEPNRPFTPETLQWIQTLKDRNGNGCCSQADGYPADVEWDTGEDASRKYRVRIEGKWYPVPDSALLDNIPNKVGYAMVWWFLDNSQDEGNYSVVIRCFLPGDLN